MSLQKFVFLTVFAVDFDGVGGQLQRRATLVCLWEPEVLYLTVSAQYVDLQHCERKRGKDGKSDNHVCKGFVYQHQVHCTSSRIRSYWEDPVECVLLKNHVTELLVGIVKASEARAKKKITTRAAREDEQM